MVLKSWVFLSFFSLLVLSVTERHIQSIMTFGVPFFGLCVGANLLGPWDLQARILEWVAVPSSRGSFRPRDWTCISGVSCTDRMILCHWWHLGSPTLLWAKSLQSCVTLGNSMDCSLLGSSVQGIIQARILEWVAIPFSRGSSWPRHWIQVSCIAGRFFTIWTIGKPLWGACFSLILSSFASYLWSCAMRYNWT